MAVTIAENMNNKNSHSLLVEMQNGTVTLGYSVIVSYTTKRVFITIQQSHLLVFDHLIWKVMST